MIVLLRYCKEFKSPSFSNWYFLEELLENSKKTETYQKEDREHKRKTTESEDKNIVEQQLLTNH